MKCPAMLLLLISLALAQSQVFTQQSQDPFSAVAGQLDMVIQIAIVLMFTMIVLSVVVYMVSQVFGAEMRAKATVWIQGMLVAVGVCALVLFMLYFIMPAFMRGAGPTEGVVETLFKVTRLLGVVLPILAIVLVVLAAAAYALGQIFGAEARARAAGWANGLIAGAVLATVIYLVIFQIIPPLGQVFFVGTKLGLYWVVMIEIVFFVSAFILITYLVSRVFKVPEWEAYLNIELSNLMSSFLIVLFVVGLFAFSTIFSIVSTNGAVQSPPLAAVDFMQKTVADSVLRATVDVYQINACTSILNIISRRMGEYVLTQTFKLFPGIDTFVSITNTLGFILIGLYSTIAVQINMLYFVDATMTTLFMPAGLILRFLPPTRDAGAFLISLAFGFQVIFPVTYMINKEIFEGVGAEPYKSPALLIQSLCGPFKFGVAGIMFNTSANPVFSMIPGGVVVGTFLARVFSESLLNFVSMAEFVEIMRHIAVLSLIGIFMPALSMMITIAFINAMTKFIVAKV